MQVTVDCVVCNQTNKRERLVDIDIFNRDTVYTYLFIQKETLKAKPTSGVHI